MKFRRPIIAVTGVALLGFALPVMSSTAAQAAACGGLLQPPCPAPVTEIVTTTGTPVDAAWPDYETTSRIASFDITVDPAETSIHYECQFKVNGTFVQPFTEFDDKSDDCTVYPEEGEPSVGKFHFEGLLLGSYEFTVRATRVPAPPLRLGQPLTDPTPVSYIWNVVKPPPGPVIGGPQTVLGNAPRFWLTQNFFSVDIRAASNEPLSEAVCRFDGRVTTKRCTPTRWTYFGTGPGDHTMSVAAVDMDGLQDPTPVVKMFNVPQSAVRMHGLRGFKRAGGNGYMLQAYVYATKKGASITRKFTGVRRVAVVVTKGPRLGSLKVYVGKRLVKTIRLQSSTVQHRKVVLIKKSSRKFRGPLKIVAASNRRVIVEAVGLSTR